MKTQKTWIWQHADYPHFNYDKDEIEPLIHETIKTQGLLGGEIRYLSSTESHTIMFDNAVNEIMLTSKLEGEILKRSSVRESLRKQLDKEHQSNHANTHTDNLVEIQEDANNNHEPLTIDKLQDWHYNLLIEGDCEETQTKPGTFREYDDMYISSGEGAKKKIHYQAIPHDRIDSELRQFIAYCNSSKDNPIIKSAIVHIWFEQIHPFGDGNGRIGRNITNHILSKEFGLDTRYFSLSSAILNNGKKYYETLEHTNRLSANPNLDLTAWIKVHTSFILQAINTTIKHIEQIIEKTNFYDQLKNIKINDNQSKVINWLLQNKNSLITNAIYRSMTGTNQVTASRHLADLVKKEVLKTASDQKGRSIAYTLIFNDYRQNKL